MCDSVYIDNAQQKFNKIMDFRLSERPAYFQKQT